VEFDTIAREWRLKWSPDNDKKSLASVQQSLALFLPAMKNIDGVKSVQRIVCGGCLDYKVSLLKLIIMIIKTQETMILCRLKFLGLFNISGDHFTSS
jgi:hypothetical protein